MFEIGDKVKIDLTIERNSIVYHRVKSQAGTVLGTDDSPGWGDLRYSYHIKWDDGSINWVNGLDVIKLDEASLTN